MEKYYLTTPVYYVNDRPHVGHAYTTFAADAIASWGRFRGDDVYFLAGTDENAQKNAEAAAKRLDVPAGTIGRAEIQAYVDAMSALWQRTWEQLGIRNDGFIRTTSNVHRRGVEEFIRRVRDRGDIYRGTYRGLYCTPCEAFLPEGNLVDGKCPDHRRTPERIAEENYFFKLSRYRDELLRHIDRNPTFIQPESRRNEVIAYIEQHLEDMSISRPQRNWGIPFPGDATQAVYVWFDALTNYLTGVGFGTDDAQFARWWPASVHIVGKDIIKFHCALWPAMLLSAGLPLPERVFAHGFFTVDGQKMSKSIGNVVDPLVLVDRYGTDALRHFLLREIRFGEDGDFSEERLRERYATDLQHGIGNFASRTIAMIQKYAEGHLPTAGSPSRVSDAWVQYAAAFDAHRLHDALGVVHDLVRSGDRSIEDERPWELAKRAETDRLRRVLGDLAELLRHVALLAIPFLPTTADRILTSLGQDAWRSERLPDLQAWGRLKDGTKMMPLAHLFPPLTDAR